MLDILELLAFVNSLVCISLTSYFFGIKLAYMTRPISYARILVLILIVVSWAFSVGAILVNNVNNYGLFPCAMSAFLCIIMYAISKAVTYPFLIEKVHSMS